MMVSTHILIGGVLGYLTGALFGASTGPFIVAGMFGGLLPELDFLIGHHRKTLHFPFGYFILTAVVAGAAAVLSGLTVVALAVFAAGVHSFMDIFAGAELRSWDRSEWQDTAVYDHLHGQWLTPRRWAYGGSVPDLLLSLGAGAALYVLAPVKGLVPIYVTLCAVAVLYTLTIRQVSDAVIDSRYDTLNGFIRDQIGL